MGGGALSVRLKILGNRLGRQAVSTGYLQDVQNVPLEYVEGYIDLAI
jgi:hypothetical protein